MSSAPAFPSSTALPVPALAIQGLHAPPAPTPGPPRDHDDRPSHAHKTLPYGPDDRLAPFTPPRPSSSASSSASSRPAAPLGHRLSATSLRQLVRTPGIQAALTGSIGCMSSAKSTATTSAATTTSAGSCSTSTIYPSPRSAVDADLTPLPSPLAPGDSPGPWRRLALENAAATQQQQQQQQQQQSQQQHPPGNPPEPSRPGEPPRRKPYINEAPGHAPPALSHQQQQQQQQHQQQQWHARNRSISDYTPEPKPAMPPKPLGAPAGPPATATSTAIAKPSAPGAPAPAPAPHIRREQVLVAAHQPPTPPPSESAHDPADSSSSSSSTNTNTGGAGDAEAAASPSWFDAHDRYTGQLRRWHAIRTVGQGTFSRVVLATSQADFPRDLAHAGIAAAVADRRVDRGALVAVKICEHGPLGGASEERVEMSLKRELDIMQAIRHPSMVDLKAWRIEPARAVLVLSFCPGGDLFDIATAHRRVLTPPLLRRVFAELVGAVGYLHRQGIVHRDIKLENVLVNLTPAELADPAVDWAAYPRAVVALADLGLSRRIAPDEKLETRCGSEDYAAPEVIMGQPYDGLATDAWSLGVLLYAMLEARLPFDPHPRMNDSHRMRSRTSHRIARVDWRWLEYEGDDGDHDACELRFRERGLLGAMRITEGLLKRARSRWTLDRVAAEPWVRDGMASLA